LVIQNVARDPFRQSPSEDLLQRELTVAPKKGPASIVHNGLFEHETRDMRHFRNT